MARFSPEEVPDPLAKRWFKLININADGFLGRDEWAYYQAARQRRAGCGRSASAAVAT